MEDKKITSADFIRIVEDPRDLYPNVDEQTDEIVQLLLSDDYDDRLLGEYKLVTMKYDKLHNMYVKRVVGELDFTPKCPIELWREQLFAMGHYMEVLRMRMDIENVEY